MRTALVSVPFLVALLAGAAGCSGSSAVLVGGTSLDGEPLDRIEIWTASDDGHCPGERVKIVAKAHMVDGEQMLTKGGGGSVGWENYEVEVSHGRYAGGGEVVLPEDPRRFTRDRPVTVEVSSEYHPALARTEIAPDYGCDYVADFSGSDGADGQSGMDGFRGESGGSRVGPNPGPNPRGGISPARANGEDGGDGGDGGTVLTVVTSG